MKINTNYGVVEGVEQDGIKLFFGIPYAKAERFKKPVAPDKWEGVLPCAHPRACCMQSPPAPQNLYFKEFYNDSAYHTDMSEDCLNLNIRTPDTDGKAPVAVYIHGGGFAGGYNAEIEFDSNTLSKKGVVLVTINYRLGAFGFLATEEIFKEQGTAGNFGILDQIAALKWVQENIQYFGGDPDKVTIFGQSAGCMSCYCLSSSPLAKGLFHRAIFQSGAGYEHGIHGDRTLEMAYEQGNEFMNMLKVSTLEELRQVPAEKILKITEAQTGLMFQRGVGLFLRPTVDGYVLTMGNEEILDNNEFADIDVMIGSTENDLTCNPEQIKSGEDCVMKKGMKKMCNILEAQGRKPSYMYYFTRHLPGDGWGAFHSAELWYCFDSLDRCWRPMTDKDYALADMMSSYWANFIKTGDPNGENVPEWKQWSASDEFVKELITEGGNFDDDIWSNIPVVDFWASDKSAEELAQDAYL